MADNPTVGGNKYLRVIGAGLHRAPKHRINTMADTPCQLPGRGAIIGPGQGQVLRVIRGNQRHRVGPAIRGAGPSPKKGEGVPR